MEQKPASVREIVTILFVVIGVGLILATLVPSVFEVSHAGSAATAGPETPVGIEAVPPMPSTNRAQSGTPVLELNAPQTATATPMPTEYNEET